jgi:cytochrome d ubiquinol oxidase subunit II
MAAVALAASVRRRRDEWPFHMVGLTFASPFGTLAISFWPYMMPGAVTVDEAAAPHSSLAFMLWGRGPFRLAAYARLQGHQLPRLQNNRRILLVTG